MGREPRAAGVAGEEATGAFVPGAGVHIPGRAGGPLSDLTFAVKNLFDTAGWFALDGATFLRVSEAALDESAAAAASASASLGRLLVARDVFAFADPAVEEGLRGSRSRLAGLAGAVADVTVASQGFSVWVRARFERYERALVEKDVAVLDDTFWRSPHTIRYAMHENGYGFDEIHAHRVRRALGPGIKERRLRLEILTLGRDFATVNLEFKIRVRDLVGRQSQTWVRLPDLGWKMVSAHVSTVNEEPLW